MSDEQSPGGGSEQDETAHTVQEQQAIATALMLGDELRRQERTQVYFYVQRIGIFVSALAFMGMVMLFGYTRLSQGAFNPTLGMVVLGALMAGGASASYWAYAQARHAKED